MAAWLTGNLALGIVMAASGIEMTPTRFVMSNGGDGGRTVTISGSGLVYHKSGEIRGGVIDTITLVTGTNGSAPVTLVWDIGGLSAVAMAAILGVGFWNHVVHISKHTAQLDEYFPPLDSGGDDTVGGSGGDNTVGGSGGDDTVSGSGGDDTVGGSGSDDTVGGSGGDDTVGGLGGDVTVGGSGGDDTGGGSGGDDTVGGSGGDDDHGGTGGGHVCPDPSVTIMGTDGKDRIRGTDAGERIELFGGSNKVKSNGGDDLIIGGDDKDTIRAGDGDDCVFGGAGNDRLKGGAGNDHLEAGGGRDKLYGDAGDDILVGADGDIQMYGRSGADTFMFATTDDAEVLLRDFDGDEDYLALSDMAPADAFAAFQAEAEQDGRDVVWTHGDLEITFGHVDLKEITAAHFVDNPLV
jgi:Ca2+-binding RTX toxin-like protein